LQSAVLWDDGVVTDLGRLPGGDFSVANGINDPGQVVGLSSAAAGGQPHAFLWEKGAMLDLGVFPGDSGSSAAGINNRGQVVGWRFQ
jgi:probable HAF family extracellular repeat protein